MWVKGHANKCINYNNESYHNDNFLRSFIPKFLNDAFNTVLPIYSSIWFKSATVVSVTKFSPNLMRMMTDPVKNHEYTSYI